MAANPPSQYTKSLRSETLRMIDRVDNIFHAMAYKQKTEHMYTGIDGLEGDDNSAWLKWVALAREQVDRAEKTGTGFVTDETRNNISLSGEQVPQTVKGLVSSIESQIHEMNVNYKTTHPKKTVGTPAVKPEPKADHQGDEGNNYVPSNIPSFYGRCLAARTGHGHEGEPCRVHLGKDGVCQYHGGSNAFTDESPVVIA
jgi:hypothetical protein